MYHIKMAFALIQVGSRLWINPVQLQGVNLQSPECTTTILLANQYGYVCSDWPIDRVLEALKPAAVSRAMGDK